MTDRATELREKIKRNEELRKDVKKKKAGKGYVDEIVDDIYRAELKGITETEKKWKRLFDDYHKQQRKDIDTVLKREEGLISSAIAKRKEKETEVFANMKWELMQLCPLPDFVNKEIDKLAKKYRGEK